VKPKGSKKTKPKPVPVNLDDYYLNPDEYEASNDPWIKLLKKTEDAMWDVLKFRCSREIFRTFYLKESKNRWRLLIKDGVAELACIGDKNMTGETAWWITHCLSQI